MPSYIHQNVFRGLHNGQPVVKKRGVKPILFIRYGYQDRFNEAIKNNTNQAYIEFKDQNGAMIFRFWRDRGKATVSRAMNMYSATVGSEQLLEEESKRRTSHPLCVLDRYA